MSRARGTAPDGAVGPRRLWRVGLLVVAGGLAVLVAGFLGWALTPLGPTPQALEALKGSASVRVSELDGGWVFVPEESTAPETGLVFYPGGRVDARSYAPFALDLADRGFTVVIARMPLSLAVLDANAADRFIDSPQLDHVRSWAVGGHSLGGAMAAQYAADNEVPGLALLAAYATQGSDLSQNSIAVVDVTGTRDGVLNQDSWLEGQALLPADTARVSIEGGNHAQFGDYGPQPGDNTPQISGSAQRRASVDAVASLLEGL